MKLQHGGTILGLIIGLLIGLGVALGVAVYVTKVPVPLVDRGVQRKPDQDAIEQERNKNWNPNAGLSTKPVNRPNAEPAEPAPASTTGAAGAPPAEAKPANSAPTPAENKPAAPVSAPSGTTDPLGDLIQSRGTPGNDATADPFAYFVQAGAFRTSEEAEAQRARLAMLGFDAKVTEREQAGRPVFRVRLGPFSKKVDADIMQERVRGQGVETALVRVQR